MLLVLNPADDDDEEGESARGERANLVVATRIDHDDSGTTTTANAADAHTPPLDAALPMATLRELLTGATPWSTQGGSSSMGGSTPQAAAHSAVADAPATTHAATAAADATAATSSTTAISSTRRGAAGGLGAAAAAAGSGGVELAQCRVQVGP